MYDNYIFDLYGTLIDIHTNENATYLWRKTAELYCAYGAIYSSLELKKSYLRLCASEVASITAKNGTHAEAEIRNVFRNLFVEKKVQPSEELIAFIAVTFRILSRKYITVYPGILNLFNKLKSNGRRIYLLSNAQSAFTMPELKETGLYPLFDDIAISSDVGICKPDPRFMEYLIHKNNISIADSIMVGNDRSSDIRIANACHMDSLFINTNISPTLSFEAQMNCASCEKATYEIINGDFAQLSMILLSQ